MTGIANDAPAFVSGLCPARPDGGGTINPDDVKAAITPKTKLILFNSPHNPTGRVFTRDEVRIIADLAIDALRDALGSGQRSRPAVEKQLTQARRAVDKAVYLLRTLDRVVPDESDDD